MYPDLVKVKIALDNGEVLGFECQGYIMAHQDERNIDDIGITIDEARDRVSKNIKIETEGMAYIPKDNKTEVLCYEFKGNYDNRNFLVYINAKTGAEEQILMLIESENGILTI